mmetsp:Transcript_22752/g.36861  ORF Transcript_22752/g.36861 Transcript_22752/m.36861 type:complete len:618 (+) Transcript_22752:62-1915(+)
MNNRSSGSNLLPEMSSSSSSTSTLSQHREEQQRVVVVQHLDYRSKADLRQKELEELRQKSLAKQKAARLQDASAPMELVQQQLFLNKQREILQQEKKNKAAAKEYLHQYRAPDDDMVLRFGRRRLRRGNGEDDMMRSRRRKPDAIASVYSYHASFLMQFTNGRNEPRNNSSEQPRGMDEFSSGSSSYISTSNSTSSHSYDSSISFEAALAALEALVSEAARIPLPADDDHEELPNDDEGPVLIVEGEMDTGAEDIETTMVQSSIPFESFLRLGESQIMEQQRPTILGNGSHETQHPGQQQKQQENKEEEENGECSESDDDSIIPSESFMKIGALLSSSKSEAEEDEEDTAPLTEAERSQMEDSTLVASQQHHQHQHHEKTEIQNDGSSVTHVEDEPIKPVPDNADIIDSASTINLKHHATVDIATTCSQPINASLIDTSNVDHQLAPENPSNHTADDVAALTLTVQDNNKEHEQIPVDESRSDLLRESALKHDHECQPHSATYIETDSQEQTENLSTTNDPLIPIKKEATKNCEAKGNDASADFVEDATQQTNAQETQIASASLNALKSHDRHVAAEASTACNPEASPPGPRPVQRRKKKKQGSGYYPSYSRHFFSR